MVLWECYTRSILLKGRGNIDYINRLIEMWNGRDVDVQSQASVLSQVKCIQKGGLLSEYEKKEIERNVQDEINNTLRDDNGKREEENIDFEIEENENHERIKISHPNILKPEHFRNFEINIPRIDIFQDSNGARILNAKEMDVLKKLREAFNSNKTVQIPSLKAKNLSMVMEEVNLVNSLIGNVFIDKPNVTNVNRLLYAGSYVVCERLGFLKKERQADKREKPWWQRRLERSITQWRKDLSRIAEMSNDIKLKERVTSQLERRYQIKERGLRAVKVFLENKIKAGSTKIRSFVASKLQSRQNTLFKNNRRQLFKELGGNSRKQYDSPNSEEARQFWSKIWSEEGTFNRNAAWLRDIEDDFSRVKQQENVQITTGDVLKGIRKMSTWTTLTWKAPGPDGVQGFWFKKFTSVHQRIVEALSQCLNEGCVPDWMVKGRTVLIQKNPDKGTSAENFRPITCLPLMWKLLTGIFSESIYNHLEANCLLKDEQKGCRKKSRGTKDQLLVDKAVMRWDNLKHKCLSIARVVYKGLIW